MERSSATLTGQRRQIGASPSSPRLVRSRSGSGTASITTPESSSSRYRSSQRFVNGSRSKSTSKSRTRDNEENINLTTTTTTAIQRKIQDSRDSKRATSVTKSRSAWALSPGRSLGSPLMASPAAKVKGSGGSSGVSKVLKYFNRKKVSPVEENHYHRFRIFHNRLLQWRFVNARAVVAMATSKRVAEIRLFSVWLRILILRNEVMEKKIEIQKLKNIITLYQIVNPQVLLLNEWTKLEGRNQESVSKLAKKLSAFSNKLPLIHGLKADVKSLYQAMSTAIEVMESIEQLITQYQTQVEKILYQVTELTATSKQDQEYLQELLGTISIITTLMDNEKSITVHLIQRSMELKNGQSCI